MNDAEYITLDEARAILRVTQRQVYRLAAEGKIATLQTKAGRLYSHADVQRIAQERGASSAGEVLARGSDNAQARQIAALLRQQSEVLARLEQRPADPQLIDRLDRIETSLTDLQNRPAPASPSGPPTWFYVVLALAAIAMAFALLALAFLR
jgi:hypothetical protein